MENDMRENSKTIEGTVMENSDGLMEEFMKVGGKPENNMEKEYLLAKIMKKRKENGKMERGSSGLKTKFKSKSSTKIFSL